jgi:nitroreductase
MQAIEALLERRSAKALTAPAPDEGALELIFASAAAAPDHGRLRPWRFIVIQGNGLERFGDLLADHLRRSHPSSAPESLAALALGFNSMWKTGAPAYDEQVKAALGLGAKDAIVGFMYLGTDAAQPDRVARPSWRDRVHHWGA